MSRTTCPLYYDAINEKGLGVAGLNFVGNAAYQPEISGKDNVAQYELIPWLLGQCATLTEARTLLSRMSMINIPYSDMLPLAQLHWLIADRTEPSRWKPPPTGCTFMRTP